MPSPFPGMDPFLEGSEWASAHIEISAEIARQLAPQVRPRYFVRTMRRFVVDTGAEVSITAGDVYPDVAVTYHPATEVGNVRRESDDAPMATAVTTLSPPLRLPTLVPTRVPHVSLEIRDAARRTLVAAIELLSLANKRGTGYRAY